MKATSRPPRGAGRRADAASPHALHPLVRRADPSGVPLLFLHVETAERVGRHPAQQPGPIVGVCLRRVPTWVSIATPSDVRVDGDGGDIEVGAARRLHVFKTEPPGEPAADVGSTRPGPDGPGDDRAPAVLAGDPLYLLDEPAADAPAAERGQHADVEDDEMGVVLALEDEFGGADDLSVRSDGCQIDEELDRVVQHRPQLLGAPGVAAAGVGALDAVEHLDPLLEAGAALGVGRSPGDLDDRHVGWVGMTHGNSLPVCEVE